MQTFGHTQVSPSFIPMTPASFQLATLQFLASSLKPDCLGEASILTSWGPHLPLCPAGCCVASTPVPAYLQLPLSALQSMLLFLVQAFIYLHLQRSWALQIILLLGTVSCVGILPPQPWFSSSFPGTWSSLQPLNVGVAKSLALSSSPPACSFPRVITPTFVAL